MRNPRRLLQVVALAAGQILLPALGLMLLAALISCGGGGDGILGPFGGTKPVISAFSASHANVTLGQATTLTWTVVDASSLTLDPGGISVTGTTSRQVTPTSAGTITYTLIATNSSGSTTATTQVTVTAAPQEDSSTQAYTSTTGGEFQTPQGAKVLVPVGAVPLTATGGTGTMTFSIQSTTASTPNPPAGETRTTSTYRFGPDGFNLALPVKVTLPVSGDRQSNVVHLYRVDPTLNQAVLVPSTYDPVNRTVSAATRQFSTWYATYGSASNTADGALNITNSSSDKWLKVCVDTYQLTYSTGYHLPTGWGGQAAWAPPGTVGWASSGKYILPQGTYTLCFEMNTRGTLSQPPGNPVHWFRSGITVNQPYVYPEYRTSGDHTYGSAPADAVAGPCPCQPTTTPSAGTGQVQVTLTWASQAAVDLDLHVWDPAGTHINWRNTTSPSGGALDLDNKCSNYVNGRPENIFWGGTAPTGAYTVKVSFFGNCGNNITSMPFEVRVINKGSVQTYQGTVTTSDGDSAPKQVCTFTVN